MKILPPSKRLRQGYIDFLSTCKTERECARFAIDLAEENGYVSLEAAIKEKRPLQAGDRVWAHAHGKALMLVEIGFEPFEAAGLTFSVRTSIRRGSTSSRTRCSNRTDSRCSTRIITGNQELFQWVTVPLAIHGVVVNKGTAALSMSWSGKRPTIRCSASPIS